MKAIARVALALVVVLGSSGCTIRHLIEEDYPQYLANNAGTGNLPKTDRASGYALTPETQAFSYEFRAAMTGYANLWVVEFGKMLDDTLKAEDVQEAFGGLQKLSDPAAAAPSLLVFDLETYTFEDFGAHVALNVSLTRGGDVVFKNTYVEDGKSQGGKMFWGGAFAQKNAVQQSTKLALDQILHRLIADLNALAE